jgi:hypothetical protein
LTPSASKTVRHHLNTIRLLDPQLFGTRQYGTPFSTGSGHKQHREFVDSQRNQLFRNLDTFEFSCSHAQVSHRLAADFTLVFQSDVRTHQAQDVDNTRCGSG